MVLAAQWERCLFFKSLLFSFVEEENKNIFVKVKSKHCVCGHSFILLQLWDERP